MLKYHEIKPLYESHGKTWEYFDMLEDKLPWCKVETLGVNRRVTMNVTGTNVVVEWVYWDVKERTYKILTENNAITYRDWT